MKFITREVSHYIDVDVEIGLFAARIGLLDKEEAKTLLDEIEDGATALRSFIGEDEAGP